MNFVKALCIATLMWAALGLQAVAYAGDARGIVTMDIKPECRLGPSFPCVMRLDGDGASIMPMAADDNGSANGIADGVTLREIKAMPEPPGQPWSLTKLNAAIVSANFIVEGRCSGTLVALEPRPKILTNYHCVDQRISVREREETDHDGRVKKVKREHLDFVTVSQKQYNYSAIRVGRAEYTTKIIAHQKTRDLALLEVLGDLQNSIAIQIQKPGGQIYRGEEVYSVGNPNMLDASLNRGVISSLTRRYEFSWAGFEPIVMIQFSGGITGGSSGGSLLNLRGELIGVPAAGYRGNDFIGLAINVRMVREFLAKHCQASVYSGDHKADEACRADKAKKAKKEKDD